MKRNVLSSFVLISLLTFSFSCNREISTKGEIFVVTKGADTIKLSMVEVSAFSEESLKEYLPAKRAEVAKLQDERNKASLASTISLAEMQKAGTKQFVGSSQPGESDDAYSKADGARRAFLTASEQLTRGSLGARYSDGLPKATVTSTTDSDGKFSLKFPKPGKYAIFAKSQRLVFDATELYCWLVWVDVKSDGKSVTLNNTNQVDSNSGDQVIAVVGQ